MTSKRDLQTAGGRWLRQAREQRGYATAAALARRMGVSESMVSRIETGASAATDERAEQIADALGMDVVDVRRGLGLWVPEVIAPAAGVFVDSGPEEPKAMLEDALELIRRARELGRPEQTPEERLRESMRVYRRLISEAADGMDEVDEAIHRREAG